jgi:hypothetical protein
LGSSTSRGPQTYSFEAKLDEQAVSTEDWTVFIEDPYSPIANSDTTHSWDNGNGILSVNNYTDSLGANFPDNIVLLQTGSASFDSLTITVESLASELVGIGITGPFQPRPRAFNSSAGPRFRRLLSPQKEMRNRSGHLTGQTEATKTA